MAAVRSRQVTAVNIKPSPVPVGLILLPCLLYGPYKAGMAMGGVVLEPSYVCWLFF